MSHQSSLKMLKAASLLLVGFGLLFFLSVFTPVSGLSRLFLDLVIWPFDGQQSLGATETRLMIAISGGLLAGWGVMFWLVTTQVYATNPALGGRIILPGIVTWFVIDSLGSILAGASVNALLNITFLVIFALPVVLRSSDDAKGADSGTTASIPGRNAPQ